ncbi:MAG TPA: glycoside hydrolase domain-containing protein [Gaiellaceae bacterium]|nr:glycoside hydrolase domain-containing protein [Gaiellaceae bacterium]
MDGVVRRLALLVLVVLALSAGSGAARSLSATVGVYPSGTTFSASAAAPVHAASSVSLAMPVGGVDDATLLVRGAQQVSISSPAIAAPLQLKLLFAHYVSVGGKPVPDALMPWDGSQRATEHTNQPVWLQVTVPYGTAPGTYQGSVVVAADGSRTSVPIAVTVSPVTLPRQNQVAGSLLTAFNSSPQSYANKAAELYGVSPESTLPGLFSFLASYRLSPNSWGYGNPRADSGYTSDRRWWLDKTGQMIAAAGQPAQFASMWIPISNNRWSPSTYVGGRSPFKPQGWCSYLRAVHGFWQQHGWLGSYPYLYGMDEPGASRFRVVGKQAKETHSCFPGGHVLVTGKPTAQNRFLWNGGSDDVDVWVVLASRYYGRYTNPSLARRGISHAREELALINSARRHHKQIWAYTYDAASHSTPGFAATEATVDPRVFADWAAYEGITGLLYGQGTTTYSKGNPLVSNDRADGSYVLLYPGRNGPIASARLEVLREGIEDWEILDVVRQRHGAATVRKLLRGLFSSTAKGARLGCTIGCPLRTSTPYSWPKWSRDAGTVASMRAAALRAASS